MTSIPDHYAALGIDPTADQEVITAAYRALAKKYHPDTGATAGTASPERFDEIQRAYEVLRTPESRHRYDLELLAETERALAEHLAAKRRVVPYAARQTPAPPPPDLGDIRPEPAVRPTRARPRPQRSVAPFLVPVVLLLAIAGGGAWLFLPKAPDAPPLPQSATNEPAVATPKATAPAQVAEPEPAAAAPEPPLFGSTATEDVAPVRQASATPAPTAAPDEPAARPIFGSSLDDAPALPTEAQPAGKLAPEPPVPKPRPANAARQALKQTAPARQLQPEPQPEPAPVRRVAEQGPYRLVIFQRQPDGEATAWSAGLVFDSQGSCTQFGVKTVLRRLASQPPGAPPAEIWYECQQR